MQYRSKFMNHVIGWLLASLLLVGCQPIQPVAPQTNTDTAPTTASTASKPNILLIVLDDVGFADIGAFGSEIATPTIDTLATQGVKFTDFHTAPNCSPTRAMLLTGADNHQVGLGNMAEYLQPEQQGQPGYEGHLNESAVTVASLLQDGGYHTYMAGKWHLGTQANDPYNRGFEQSFALMQGMAGHYAAIQPAFEGLGTTYTRNGELTEVPEDFYSSQYYTDQLISQIDANKDDGKPFFIYAAYTAPHAPLQAPAEWLEKYRGHYDAGYEAIRAERIERIKQMGIIPAAAETYPRLDEVKAWDTLTAEEKAQQSRRMEAFAAALSAVDFHIGRLFDHLRAIGQYDNTLIIFLTDNGPEADDPAEVPSWQEWLDQQYDNSLENIGNPTSFVYYGKGWAQAGAGPFRLFKLYTAEGGIRTPLIISGPGVTRIGESSDAFVHVTDITPTILEAAGLSYPESLSGQARCTASREFDHAFYGWQTRLCPPRRSSNRLGSDRNGRRA